MKNKRTAKSKLYLKAAEFLFKDSLSRAELGIDSRLGICFAIDSVVLAPLYLDYDKIKEINDFKAIFSKYRKEDAYWFGNCRDHDAMNHRYTALCLAAAMASTGDI